MVPSDPSTGSGLAHDKWERVKAVFLAALGSLRGIDALDPPRAGDTAWRVRNYRFDLKSSNVVIERGGRAIVLDFGLAKRLPHTGQRSESLTASQHGPAGTLTHIAPEVLLGGRGDTRSDIWSMGVLRQHQHWMETYLCRASRGSR